MASHQTQKGAWENLLLIALITFSATTLEPALRHGLIVWNVGQGQMLTWVESDMCSHFDVGGEVFPKEVLRLCRGKQNRIYVTHADFDHISFLPRLKRSLDEVCLAEAPLLLDKPWQWRYLASVKPCSGLDGENLKDPRVTTIHPLPKRGHQPPSSLNAWSKIYVILSTVLIPGDSIKTMEKIWVHLLPRPDQIEFLIAGHHGSNTSTSEELLRELTGLRVVIVSARKKRYGHPHRRVLERVAKHRALIYQTEIQGHYTIELPTDDRAYVPFPSREPPAHRSRDRRSSLDPSAAPAL